MSKEFLDQMQLFSPPMGFDLRGRVHKTPVRQSEVLLPLFEAVVNSIHSTQDRFGSEAGKHGEITIEIIREPQALTLAETGGGAEIRLIKDIKITDNGQGFNAKNFEAFITADTTAKLDRGGKGVGRFSWLVVFTRAEVQSVYSENGGLRRRKFTFACSHKGIEDADEARTKGALETCVHLRDVKQKYAAALRQTTQEIADKLFEHCLSYILLGNCPRITLRDADLGDQPETISVTGMQDQLLKVDDPVTVELNGRAVQIQYITRPARGSGTHVVHLCAHHRVVKSYKMSALSGMPDLPIKDDEFYPKIKVAYVSSELFDEYVDPGRGRIDLPEPTPLSKQLGEFSLGELKQALEDNIDATHRDHIVAYRAKNLKDIESYILTNRPDLVPMLEEMRERLGEVDFDPASIEKHLFLLRQEWERAVRERRAGFTAMLADEDANFSEVRALAKSLIDDIKLSDQATLAQHVANRKAVIEIIKSMISWHEQGPAKEAAIHELIFPRFKSNRQVGYDQHNLWLIDTSLSFYEYLTSDLTLRKSKAAVDSSRRPDILAFQTGGSPYRNIVMIELKRPERKDSNPVMQMIEYVQELRAGEAFDAGGRRLSGIDPSARIDAFAIMTITPEARAMFEQIPGLRPAGSPGHWRCHHDGFNMNIEVLDFSELIARAERQNFPLFKKLGLIH